MSDLYYLTYVSTIGLKAFLTSSTLSDIATVAKQRNLEDNITGFFCYGNQYFFQYIEGPHEEIDDLYRRLRQDKRHNNMQILSQGKCERRLFSEWQMYAVTFDEFITQYSSAHPYIPFVPYVWQEQQTHDFIMMFHEYYRNNDDKNKKQINMPHPIAYNRLGLSLNEVLGKHQSFMFAKVMLLFAALIVGVVMLQFFRHPSRF